MATWPHVQLFHGEGWCLPYWQIALLEKKNSQNFDFFWFCAPEEERKCQRSKRRMNGEERRGRKNWKTQKKGKDKVCAFRFFFICGLSVIWDCIFGFVVRMRDKKTKFNRENGTSHTMLLLFLIFSNFGLTRETHETWSRFSNPDGLTAVRTIHCIFGVQQVLGLKELSQGTVPS